MELRIGLATQVRIEAEGRVLEVPTLAGRQGRLAFVYLAVERHRPVPRDELAELLWPGVPPSAWERNLSVVISRLRTQLAQIGLGGPGVVTSASGCYQLHLPSETRVDVEEALAAVGDAEAALRVKDAARALSQADRAAGLTRDPFLPGDDGTWVEEMRAARTRLLLRALDAGTVAAMAVGEGARAVAMAEEAVDLDPFRETGHQQLMRALASIGDRAHALQAYERCRRLLADELGVNPSPQTESVYLELLRADARSGPASPSPPGIAPPPSGHVDPDRDWEHDERRLFIGREQESAELTALLGRAAGGRGGLVMIGGEAGVGKTRLSREIATVARRRDFRVLTGHCYQVEGDLPYMPWIEILESAVREAPPTVLREALGAAAPELALILPQLRTLFPDLPPPIELSPEQRRRHLFSRLADYLVHVARTRPQLIILEDLHWADRSTLLLLEHLAEQVQVIPVLVLGTYRDPPVDVSPAFTATLTELVRHRRVRLLTLARLSEAEVGAMLEALTSRTPPPTLATAVHTLTEGNAFFVEEVCGHLMESGRMLDERGEYRTDLHVDSADVPKSVQLVTADRLARVGHSARRMLDVAAIAGRHFTFELLEEVGDVRAEALLDAIDEAERARLIVSDPATDQSRLRFAHELIRQAVLAGLSSPRTRRYHLQVANALARIHAEDLERHAAEIAQHLLEAGSAADRSWAIRLLTTAGDWALSTAAFDEALRAYRNALLLTPASDSRGRADLLLRVGRAQQSLRRWHEATSSWDEALTLLENMGEIDAVATVCRMLGAQLIMATRFEEALAVAQRGLAALGDGAGPKRAKLLAVAALALDTAGRPEDADTHLKEAWSLVPSGEDTRLDLMLAFTQMSHDHFCMRIRQASERGRQVTASLRRTGSLWGLVDGLAVLYLAHVLGGRLAEAEEVKGEFDSVADRVGNWGAISIVRSLSGFPVRAAAGADLDELERLALTQAAVARDTGSPIYYSWATTVRGIVEFWRGQWSQAYPLLAEGAREARTGAWFGVERGCLLVFLAFTGAEPEARRMLLEVAEDLPRPGRLNTLGAWNLAILSAEAAGLLGASSTARKLYPVVVEALATGTVVRLYDGRLIQTAAGIVAAAAGLREAAEEHFEESMRQAEELPHLIEQPHVRDAYARFLATRSGDGDLERARVFLEQAVSAYHRIGMPRHLARAQLLLEGLSSETERPQVSEQ